MCKFLGGSVSIESFRNLALNCAKSLRNKYYTVANIYSPEDIVQEVITSCIQYNKIYDKDKRSLFGFTRMLVDRQYHDLLRYHECRKRKESSTVSLNDVVTDSNQERLELIKSSSTYDALLEDTSIQGFLDTIKAFSDCFNRRDREKDLDMHTIIKYKLQGYSHKEIATNMGVRDTYIGDMLRNNHRVILDMINDYFGSDHDLGLKFKD